MKEIRTEDAAGQILCHDITQIIKDEKKGVLFSKGHIVKEEDIPLLLSVGKEHLFVWEKKEGITLSETERDVLRLSAQGYTMNDIADRLCKSVDTIKACKRNLFAKMGVKNIAEALFHATNYQMIYPSSG